MVSRDILLAEATGGRIHVMHVSSGGSVEIIRRAKSREVRVTAEICPHHFTLTDDCLSSFDSNFKMSPTAQPARCRNVPGGPGRRHNRLYLHRPRTACRGKKMRELDQAPFGIVGLETCLGLVITKLIEPGILDWPTAISKMTINPAQILGIPKGTLVLGADADVTIIDPDVRWTVDPHRFHSKSVNTPFAGWQLRGRAEKVIVGGRVKYRVSRFSMNRLQISDF